jgi:hypothetical protein
MDDWAMLLTLVAIGWFALVAVAWLFCRAAARADAVDTAASIDPFGVDQARSPISRPLSRL